MEHFVSAAVGKDEGLKRGWYIADRLSNYLHKDGRFYNGINAQKGGFWKTKNEAQGFLEGWRSAMKLVAGE